MSDNESTPPEPSPEPATNPLGFDPEEGVPQFPGGDLETGEMPTVQPSQPGYDPQTGEYLNRGSLDYPTQPGSQQPAEPTPATPPTAPNPADLPTQPIEYPTQPPRQS